MSTTPRQRVVQEHLELLERLQKLEDFLTSAKFDTLPAEQQSLLMQQVVPMRHYSSILQRRLNIWPEDPIMPKGLPCPHCNPSGVFLYGDERCTSCHGTGYLPFVSTQDEQATA
jgi:hypothetical protein